MGVCSSAGRRMGLCPRSANVPFTTTVAVSHPSLVRPGTIAAAKGCAFLSWSTASPSVDPDGGALELHRSRGIHIHRSGALHLDLPRGLDLHVSGRLHLHLAARLDLHVPRR